MTRSPRRLKDQVRETVSELPIHAARLAVMGVGQALLLTDRVRKDYKEARESGLTPVLGRLIDDAEDLTGRLVGKVTGRAEPDGRAGAPEGAVPTPTGSEISVGKPAAAARTRPATGRTKPPTRTTSAKGATATPSRAKGGATSDERPSTAARQAGTAAAKPARAAGTAAKPAKAAGTPEAEAKPTRAATAESGPKPTAAEGTRPARRTPSAKGTAPTAPAKTRASSTTPAKDSETAPASPAKDTAPAAVTRAEEQPSPTTETAAGAKATAAISSAAKTPTGSGEAPGKQLPIADYDQATIASVRARLRNLNARQVNELRDYERAHSARAEFLRMYENRIAKLRGQG